MEVNLFTSCDFFEVPVEGNSIRMRTWGKPGGHAALLVHGLGAHSGWFEAFGKELAAKGFAAVAPDHAYFGFRSKEPGLGATWIKDLSAIYDHIAGQSQSVTVMANSMGALVALLALADKNPAGLVMFSPGFDGGSAFTLPWRLKTLFQALVTPKAMVALPYSTSDITQSETSRKFIDADSLGKMIVPAGVMLEVLKISNAASQVRNVSFPILMCTSGQDVIVSTVAAKRFFDRLSAPSKDYQHFENAYHDLMFEPCLPQVADAVAQWHSQLKS